MPHDSKYHKKPSRSRSRSNSEERSAAEARIRRNKTTRFDDPNPPPLPTQVEGKITAFYNYGIQGGATEGSKLRKKIFLPKHSGVNFVGLIIGPKGMYQKKLEEQTGCKILIRGKAFQKDNNYILPEEEEDQHVLISGDNEAAVQRAESAINAILNADEETRNAIRATQLKTAEEMNSKYFGIIDESLLTPYGPANSNAQLLPIPNEAIGLIIGKGGETIRQLQQDSGAKIQVAKKELGNSGLRYVFIDGPPPKFEVAKKLIEAIVDEYRRSHVLEPGVLIVDYPIPAHLTNSIIGKGGETLRKLTLKTKAQLFIPKQVDNNTNERVLKIKGTPNQIEDAKKELAILITTHSHGNRATNKKKDLNDPIAQAEQVSNLISASLYMGDWMDYKTLTEAARKEDERRNVAASVLYAAPDTTSYASFYQKNYANYDPLYEYYFGKVRDLQKKVTKEGEEINPEDIYQKGSFISATTGK